MEEKEYSKGEMINFARWCVLDLLSDSSFNLQITLDSNSLSKIENILKSRMTQYSNSRTSKVENFFGSDPNKFSDGIFVGTD